VLVDDCDRQLIANRQSVDRLSTLDNSSIGNRQAAIAN